MRVIAARQLEIVTIETAMAGTDAMIEVTAVAGTGVDHRANHEITDIRIEIETGNEIAKGTAAADEMIEIEMREVVTEEGITETGRIDRAETKI
jgi:hypothetical protein